MNVEIIPYSQGAEEVWDDFCENSWNGNFLHSRLFLGYHKNRFKDTSVLIMKSGKIVGLFPSAESPTDNKLVISHPGITYGGILHQGKLIGARMIEALTHLSEYYKKSGYRRLQYKIIPYIYAKIPTQDDLYALSRLGANRFRCDLSCTIDLSNRQPLKNRRKRCLKKAFKLVSLSNDPSLLEQLWDIIIQNLSSKHKAKPVHSLAEMSLLKECFPQNIYIQCALLDGVVEAGVLIFVTSTVWHAQYIAASEKGCQVSALDAVFDSLISEAQQAGVRYFDFGISNENCGTILNDSLYRFKSEFGGAGVVHEFYEFNFC